MFNILRVTIKDLCKKYKVRSISNNEICILTEEGLVFMKTGGRL